MNGMDHTITTIRFWCYESVWSIIDLWSHIIILRLLIESHEEKNEDTKNKHVSSMNRYHTMNDLIMISFCYQTPFCIFWLPSIKSEAIYKDCKRSYFAIIEGMKVFHGCLFSIFFKIRWIIVNSSNYSSDIVCTLKNII